MPTKKKPGKKLKKGKKLKATRPLKKVAIAYDDESPKE